MLPLTRDEARRIAANIAKILASGDYFTPENPSALGLIRSLGENGVIRIGGNTSERTVWGADRRPVGPASFVITPGVANRRALEDGAQRHRPAAGALSLARTPLPAALFRRRGRLQAG